MSTVESMRFICGGCGYRARIPSSYAGKVILCPGCQQMQIAKADGGEATGDTVRMSKVATAQAGIGKFSTPDADGLLRFTCGGCGYGAKLAATYAGKAISCPQCKAPQLIPPLQGPETSAGKALPSSAPEPTAGTKGMADDELSFEDEPSAKPVVKAPVPPAVKAAALDPADEISFELEPAAARTDKDATKPTAVAPASKLAKPGSAAGAKPASKPGSGAVVRRGNRMPLAAAPEPADEDIEENEPVKPSKPLSPWAQNLNTKLKEPRNMALVGGGLAALILLIVLINGWAGASSAAAEFQAKAEANDARAKDLDKGKANAEFELSKVRSELNALKKADSDTKSALAAAQARLVETGEQAKKAEADKAEEYAKRKKAETDYDEMFTKFKAVEKKRDEEYRISTEMRRKFEEEAKLRKDLKVRLDEAQAAAK